MVSDVVSAFIDLEKVHLCCYLSALSAFGLIIRPGLTSFTIDFALSPIKALPLPYIMNGVFQAKTL